MHTIRPGDVPDPGPGWIYIRGPLTCENNGTNLRRFSSGQWSPASTYYLGTELRHYAVRERSRLQKQLNLIRSRQIDLPPHIPPPDIGWTFVHGPLINPENRTHKDIAYYDSQWNYGRSRGHRYEARYAVRNGSRIAILNGVFAKTEDFMPVKTIKFEEMNVRAITRHCIQNGIRLEVVTPQYSSMSQFTGKGLIKKVLQEASNHSGRLKKVDHSETVKRCTIWRNDLEHIVTIPDKNIKNNAQALAKIINTLIGNLHCVVLVSKAYNITEDEIRSRLATNKTTICVR